MLKNKFPPQLELISDYEINMGIRELSEGKSEKSLRKTPAFKTEMEDISPSCRATDLSSLDLLVTSTLGFSSGSRGGGRAGHGPPVL